MQSLQSWNKNLRNQCQECVKLKGVWDFLSCHIKVNICEWSPSSLTCRVRTLSSKLCFSFLFRRFTSLTLMMRIIWLIRVCSCTMAVRYGTSAAALQTRRCWPPATTRVSLSLPLTTRRHIVCVLRLPIDVHFEQPIIEMTTLNWLHS